MLRGLLLFALPLVAIASPGAVAHATTGAAISPRSERSEGRGRSSAADAAVVPKFRVNPLVLAGTPTIVGFKLTRVPYDGVFVKALARGFKEVTAKSLIDLVEVRKTNYSRVFRFRRTFSHDRYLTIGRYGIARLEIVVGVRGPQQYEGVKVRGRSIEVLLRLNRHGDVTAHQSPNGYRCWAGYPNTEASCRTLRVIR
jgi:hypothetical protein